MVARYRVITTLRCPCERCAGETCADPVVEETASLRDAIDMWHSARAGMDAEEAIEPSCDPLCADGGHPCWVSALGVAYDGGACDGMTAYEVSLHVEDVSRESRTRILRLLTGGRV